MIFLVVVIHVATVYEKNSMGADWWIVVDPSNSNLPGILFLILNIFVMATIFFISGFFAPLSLKNETGWAFLKSKFKRLIIPWMIAVLMLIPLYKMIFLYSRNLPQEHWTTYFHWSNGIFSQLWLWFLPVLFVFDILYVCFSRVNTSNITLKSALWAMFLLSWLYSFCIDFFNLHGWTKTVMIDFQNERLFIYFLIFLLGALCSTRKIFKSEWKNKKLDILIHCTGWIPINLYIFLLIYSLVKPGNYLLSEIGDTLILRVNFVLSLAYLLYVMITIFRRYLNTQGKIWRELNRNSYGVYIIHTIVMGGLAVTMLNMTIPSLVKFLLVTVSTFVVSNVIVYGYQKLISSIHLFWEDIDMKTVTTALLVITLLLVAGYGQQAHSSEEKTPPGVSLHMAVLQGKS